MQQAINNSTHIRYRIWRPLIINRSFELHTGILVVRRQMAFDKKKVFFPLQYNMTYQENSPLDLVFVVNNPMALVFDKEIIILT